VSSIATGQESDFDMAIDEHRRVADATLPDEDSRGYFLWCLGGALLARKRATDIDSAIAVFTETVQLASSGTKIRIWAAKSAAELLAPIKPREAQHLLATAMQLTPNLAPYQGDRLPAQKLIEAIYGIASDTAALTLDCELSAAAAVALLEGARFVLLGRIIDIRPDLRGLPEDLRRSYEDLRSVLDQPVQERQPILQFSKNHNNDKVELRHQPAVKFEELKLKIRELGAFRNFGLHFEPEELMEAASEGLLVSYNLVYCHIQLSGYDDIKITANYTDL
jgi:hypothetical protein